MAERVKHSGPNAKFCVLCLSGEHERIDEERAECETPDYEEGPCHCAFHDPARHGNQVEQKSAPVDGTAAVEVWARMLCSADVHVYGANHPAWQQLVGESGQRIRDDYRKAARWLFPRLTATAKAATSLPRAEGETPAPPLPAPIHTHSQWCWEPLRPLLKTRVRITDTRWDGETWWVETEALENSRMRLAGRRRWDALDSFIESAVAIDPDL
jgi:hypothetical protein